MPSIPAAPRSSTTEATSAPHGILSASTRVGTLPMIHGELEFPTASSGLPKTINGPTTAALHSSATAAASLPDSEQHGAGISAATLAEPAAGRKRSQPTGGWSSRGGVDESHGDGLGEEAALLSSQAQPQAPAAQVGSTAAAATDVAAATATELVGDAAIIVEEKELPMSCLGDFKFTFAEVNKMCKRYPTLNTLGAETAMPLLGWLTRELDMGLGDMRNLILRHPRLMAYRVTSHVAPKTKWLRERLGLGQPQLRKLITTYPAVLSRSVEENLEPKFKWLEERLGATPEEVQVLIKRFPLIFGYSTSQNLEPTVAFFTGDMSGGIEEIKAAVMSCPSILSRSLDKRIMPRAQQMREKEIEPRFGPHKHLTLFAEAGGGVGTGEAGMGARAGLKKRDARTLLAVAVDDTDRAVDGDECVEEAGRVPLREVDTCLPGATQVE
eukprot:jgi/Undpi1/1802/HiC_scaffold_12.g05189.m1